MTKNESTREMALLRSQNERLSEALRRLAADLKHTVDLEPEHRTLIQSMVKQAEDTLHTVDDLKLRFEQGKE